MEAKEKKPSITFNELRGIPLGGRITIKVEHPKKISSVRSMAYLAKRFFPEWGKQFSCKADWENSEVTITAIPL